MKKYFFAIVAILTIIAVATPSFALEVKYGGLFRLRLQSSDNVNDGNDDSFPFDDGLAGLRVQDDDNQNYIDQRLRMFFTFVASENLQVVTKWEADVLWGDENGAGRHGGGDVGADATNLEMKNAYIDFAIPMTTARATMGVQGLALLRGWVIDDDFSAAVVTGKFDPIRAQLGYVAARNEDVTSTNDNIDVYFMNLEYAGGPLKAGLITYFQDGNKTPDGIAGGTSNTFTIDPGLVGSGLSAFGFGGNFPSSLSNVFGLGVLTGANGGIADDNQLFDLGLSVEYKLSYLSAYVNFVKNFGGFDRGTAFDLLDAVGLADLDDDYKGWMVDAGANVYCGPWTFTVSGFVTSGGDITDPDDFDKFFRYPAGASHYWSEILGLGSLDASTSGQGVDDDQNFSLGWVGNDNPSNVWTIQAGVAYQVLKGTKLTFNYWYVGTVEDVPSDISTFLLSGGNPFLLDADTDSSIGHEIDFYLDQKVVDGLNLRLVGAYLFAGDAYTVFPDDDNAYELGAVLSWSF